MGKMGAKRRRKVKGGQTAAEAAADASVEGQKLSTRYEGVAEANPLNYVLLSVGGEVEADKNGGDGGSADGGGGGGRAIADQRDNQTRFMMDGKLTASRAELVAEKAAIIKGRGRGSGPGHPPKKVGLAKSKLLGRLAEGETVGEDDDIMGDLAYRERKGCPPR